MITVLINFLRRLLMQQIKMPGSLRQQSSNQIPQVNVQRQRSTFLSLDPSLTARALTLDTLLHEALSVQVFGD